MRELRSITVDKSVNLQKANLFFAFSILFLILQFAVPARAISVTGFDATDAVPLVLSGDSFVLKFQIANDTTTAIQFTSIEFAYENVANLPSYFSNAVAADFYSYTICDRNGEIIGQTVGGVGAGTGITITNNFPNSTGDSSIGASGTPGSTRSFYLVIATNTTNKQFAIKLKINSSDYNGVITTPQNVAAHSITSTILQTLNISDIDKKGAGKDRTVVGADAGPFYLWDWTIDNRTQAEATYKAVAFTCTNVRGFVPGAQADQDYNPLSFTGDIERFILEYGGSSPKSSRRRKKLYTGGWGIPAPYYSIYLTFKDDDDDADPEDGSLIIGASSLKDFNFGFYTNSYVSDLPSPGGVVPGDAWYATLDTFRLEISPSPKTYSWVGNNDSKVIIPSASYASRTTTAIYEMLGPIEVTNKIIHPHLDYNSTIYNDQTDLDYISYRPIIALRLIGGPTTTHALRAVTFLITHKAGVDFTSETSPLNPINQTSYSGIQLRRTDDNTYSMADPLYPPDVNLTTITKVSPTQTEVKYVIYDAMPLPTDSALVLKNTDQNARVWVGLEPSKNAILGDSLLIMIKPGGIEFRSGLIVYETSSQSILEAYDTYVQTQLKLDTTVFVYPLVDTAGATFGLPVIFHDLTNSGQVLPPNSAPKALASFNIWDNAQNANLGLVMFFVMDAIQAGGEVITDNDFAALANDSSSGWAIYRDNDSHPNNTNGQFDPGIDSFVGLVAAKYIPIGDPYSNTVLNSYGSGAQPLLVYLEIDPTSLDSAVPDNDLGPSLGDDYFLVCRTSPTITPQDKFRIVVGDIDPLKINYTAPGLMFSVDSDLFFTDPSETVPYNFERVFSRGYIYRIDRDTYLDVLQYMAGFLDPLNDQSYHSAFANDNLRSEIISISGGIAVNVSSLIIGQKNIYRRQELPLFGINAIDTTGGSSLYSILVDALDSGTSNNFDTRSDLAPFNSSWITKGYGLAVFQDNGDSPGQFDSKDSTVSGTWIIDSAYSGFTRFKFQFSPAVDFPDDDIGENNGFDYFVVATFGDSLLYQDDVAFRIPENAFEFIPPGSVDQPPAVTTAIMVAGMPAKLIDLPDSGSLTIDGTPAALIGIMAADTTQYSGSTIYLDKIKLRLDDPTSPGGFPSAILNPLVLNDSSSGITVWKDANGDRQFSQTNDVPLRLDKYQWQTANIIELDIYNDSAPVPDTDPYNLRSETASVFFVVFRASSLGLDHQVKITIEGENEPADPWVKFTAPTDPSITLSPNVVTIAPPGVSGNFWPLVFSPNGDNVTETITVQLSIIPGNTDSTWSLNATSVSSGNSALIGSGKFDSTVYVGKTASTGNPPTFAWPSGFTGGGAFQLSFTYDRAGTSKSYDFGDTLLVDLYCTAPILISTLPSVLTGGSTVAVSIAADSDRSNVDAYALTEGESAAMYYIYRLDGLTAALLTSDSMIDYEANNISVPLQPGNNTLAAVLRDTYGNWSETTILGSVNLSVGSNEIMVQDLLTDISKHWISIADTLPVFGINVTQADPNEAITAITLRFYDSGAFAFGNNIADVPVTGTYPETSGILIFKDNPTDGIKGTFDTYDILVPLHPAQRNMSFSSGDTVRLIPQSPLSVPEDDTTASNQGFDYYVVLVGGGGAYYKDSFSIAMPANSAFEFATTSGVRSNLASDVTTAPIYSRIPRSWIDMTVTYDSFAVGSNYAPLFGLNIYDTTRVGDGGASLVTIQLNFDIAAGDTFNPVILSYQVFADSGTSDSGTFSATNDSAVTTAVTILSSTSVKLTFAGANAGIPSTNSGVDSGPDFWIAIRPSVIAVSIDNKFTPWISEGGAVTDGDSPGGPGIRASKKVTIPQGGITTQFSPNPFRPTTAKYSNAYSYYETTGYTINFSDTRGFTVYLYRVSTGDTFAIRTGYAKDTVVVFALSDTTGWKMDEYRLTLVDTLTNVPTTDANLLYADSQALTPTLPSTPATSTTSSSLSVTIRVSEVTENSVQRARSKAERDSFMLVFHVSCSCGGDTTDTAYGALTSSSVDVTKTITLGSGLNTVNVILVDKLGNYDSTLTFTVTSGSAITGNIGFENNSPLFKYSPSNTEFTFTFPTTVASGATMEFYNISGDRMRLLKIPENSPLVTWDAKNENGQLLRNGVYLIKFKVPLSNGQTIEETRTIFLLK